MKRTNDPQNQDKGSLEAHLNVAIEHHRAGRLFEAEEIYRQILASDPDHPQALCLLGTIALAVGETDQALDLISRAISIKPDYTDAYINLSGAFMAMACFEEALATIEQALAMSPDSAEAHCNKGVILMRLDRADDAVDSYRQTIEIQPDYAEAHFNLGNACMELGRLDNAAASHENAIRFKPDYTEAHNNLGNVRLKQGRLDEAEESCRKALALNPDHAEALCTMGSILDHRDRLDEGEAACRRAIELKPEDALAHSKLALFLFRTGRLKEAWDEYEWRWRIPERALSARAYPQPRWDGSPLKGKNILLWSEQGIGDVIRYAGMIPDVLESGANVSIACDERVVDIFARSFDGTRVFAAPSLKKIAGGETVVGEYDFQCPFGSLGPFFRASQDAFPTNTDGYLKADPERLEFWKNRLLEKSRRPKVGLSWSTPINNPQSKRYIATIEEMAPILSIEGIDFVNLQSYDSSTDLEQAKSLYGADIHTWNDLDLRNDLDGVAALTSALDLVISFPTFGAEFAGALGVPTVCFCYNDNHLDFLGTGNSVWQPAIHYVTKTQDEPWQEVMENIGRMTQKKFSL